MTLPEERTRAVVEMEKAVKRLAPTYAALSKTRSVLIPTSLLADLVLWLRHYPTPADLAESAKLAPHIWGTPRDEP